MKKIIKLTDDYNLWNYIEDLEYDIKYLGKDLYDKTIKQCIDAIESINKNINGDDFTMNYGALRNKYIYEYERKDLEYLAKINNCEFSTVGYSPWSYYVAYKDISSEFIQHLYEGWYFYVVTLVDEEGFAEDFIGGCYIPTMKDLKECVSDNFGIEDFYLVDNHASTYFNLPKVKEVKHTSYSYTIA